MKKTGTLKHLRHIETPMDARVRMEHHGEVTILSSNNYLGLANHPEVVEAGSAALRRYGAGTASVRFICGTFSIHRDLERKIASFSGTQAALSYVSCWNANTGALPVLAGEGDVVISDELNHASIIDGVRLCKAKRLIYKHADMKELEARLEEAREANVRLIVSDGVFSMEGDLAPLPDIVDLAEKHDAVTVIDDSHGTGVMGKHGRGVAEHFGLLGQIDVITGTLGLLAHGFKPLEAPSAIIPIIVGETSFAIRMSERLLEEGIFVTGFGFPVVPEGTARLRVQSSAALEREDMERALEAFEKVGKEIGLI